MGAENLTPPRNLPENGRIIRPVRSDITDYGNPGVHLHPPGATAKLRLGRTRAQRDIDADGDPTTPTFGPAACLGWGGGTIAYGLSVGADSTTVQASRKQTRPFIIRHIYAIDTQLLTEGNFFRVKIAVDDDTTGGENTSGTDIDTAQNAGPGYNVSDTIREFFPNVLVPATGQVIKVIYRNLAAGASQFQAGISIEYLA